MFYFNLSTFIAYIVWELAVVYYFNNGLNTTSVDFFIFPNGPVWR